MKRFIQLSAITRLCAGLEYAPKCVIRVWVRKAIDRDQEIKARSATGGIGLS